MNLSVRLQRVSMSAAAIGIGSVCSGGDAVHFEAKLLSEVDLRPVAVSTMSVTVSGAECVVGRGIHWGRSYDMSMPEAPVFHGDMQVGDRFQLVSDVKWHNGHVFMSTGFVGQGVYAIDGEDLLSEPVGSLDVTNVRAMEFEGDFMYLHASGFGGDIHELHVADVSDPSSPSVLSTSLFPATGNEFDLGGFDVREGLAYIAAGDYGLSVWDVTDPVDPTLAGAFTNFQLMNDVEAYQPSGASGTFLAIASDEDGLLILNADAPHDIEFAGTFSIDHLEGPMTFVSLDGDLCYAVVEGTGLVVIDVSEPWNPRQVGLIPETIGSMGDVHIEGDLLYVVEFGVLRVFEVTSGNSCGALADLNADGILDFFDVSEMLELFGTQDPSVDFDGDGRWTFFDVSAFLTSYVAGCP